MAKPKSNPPVLAAFAVQLKRTDGDAAVPELHLLPDGEFKPQAAEDARQMPKSGTYRLNAELATGVIALAKACANALPIDYEHQTQRAAENGQPAPAAGWMDGAKLVYRPGEGLFAQGVEWTVRAKQMLDDDEYRYQSATFLHDPDTGDVLALVGAALTNRPALDGLTSAQLAALSAQFARQFFPPNSEDDMNPLLKALLEGLGLPETATVEEGTAALATLKAKSAELVGLNAQIATLKAAAPDPTKYVPIDTVNTLNGELATLRAQVANSELDQVIDQAKAEGKIASDTVETAWRGIGRADMAQLKALVAATAANPALAGRRQTEGKQPDQVEGELSKAELAVCDAMGLTVDQFKASKKAMANG